MNDIILAEGAGISLASNIPADSITTIKLGKLAKERRSQGYGYGVLYVSQSKNPHILNAFLSSGLQIWVSYTVAPEPVVLQRLKESGVSAVIIPAERIEVIASTIRRVNRNKLACIIRQDPVRGSLYTFDDARALRLADAYGIFSLVDNMEISKPFIGEGLKYYSGNISQIKNSIKVGASGVISPLSIVNPALLLDAWKGDVVAQNEAIKCEEKGAQYIINDAIDLISN